MKKRNTIVMGIGNPNMGDDAIGIEIVNRIKKDILDAETEVLFYVSFEILDKILGYNSAIIVDAAELGVSIGEYLIVDFKDMKKDFLIKNSHGISIFQIISIGYELFSEDMPKNIYLFLIQTKPVEHFETDMSKELIKQIPFYVEKIKNII